MQHAYARYALMPCNKDAHTFFSFFVGEIGSIPFRWKGQLAVSARHTITVAGDGAVLSRIMNLVTLAVRDFVDLEYTEVIQNKFSLSASRTSLDSYARWSPVRS